MSEENTSEAEAPSEPEAMEVTAASERPDYVPVKFWNPDEGKVNIEAMGTSYTNLEGLMGKKLDEVKAEVQNDYAAELNLNRPEAADRYVVSFAEDNPLKEIQDQIDYEDPAMKLWQDTCYKAGLSQDDFTDGVEQFLMQMIPQTDVDAELAALGENGKARVEAVDLWASNNLDENEYDALADAVNTADGIKALEKIMKATTSNARANFTDASASMKPTKEDLAQKMNDPRYWDQAKRDPAYVREVQNMAKRISS